MAVSHPKFIAAAVQAAPVYHDLAGTVAKTIRIIEEAAAAGAKLVVFPETWIPGYPYWAWLGSQAWGMQFVQTYHDNSLIVGSAEFDEIAAAARDNAIFVALGYSEKSAGSLYIAQTLFGDDGAVVFNRRKLRPTHVERAIFGDGDGSNIRVDATALGRVGALCCWEHLQPLTKYALYSMNEQVHLAAWPAFSLYEGKAHALGAEANMAVTQTYALEGQCFVIAATMVADPAALAIVADTAEKADLLPVGGGSAAIFGPDGRSLGNRLRPDEEGLVIAEIDLSAITLAKAAADPAGHYARPDVTRLLLNTEPATPVQRLPIAARPTEEPAAAALAEVEPRALNAPRPIVLI